jgi:hypothetical protein
MALILEDLGLFCGILGQPVIAHSAEGNNLYQTIGVVRGWVQGVVMAVRMGPGC